MHQAYLAALLIALAASPAAFAHNPAGTPKNYCEPLDDWFVHDYAPLATGTFVFLPTDGNVGGDCNPGFSVGVGGTIVCVSVSPSLIYVNWCEANSPVSDWDGHTEWAQGGANLLVLSGSGSPSADPSVGAGTLYCWAANGHHANFATVTVTDALLGSGATFTVTADTVDLTGTGEGCGDNLSDGGQECVGTCTVTFPAGLDGSYQVFVTGTLGHIESN